MSHRERPGRCFEFIREVCILKFFIADAFTDSLFGGNPAGVVIIPDGQDYPDDETMRKTAAELRYSETAFLRRLGDQSWQARYFTPAAEVELCGHATIGSAYCLRESGLIGEGVCRYKTLAGDLDILVQGHSVLMDMGFPRIVQDITDPGLIGEIYSTMGLNPAGRESEAAASALSAAFKGAATCASESEKPASVRMLPKKVSTGLVDIMLPVADEAELDAVTPDFPALSALSERENVVGVHAFTLNSEDGNIHARNFAPLYDIDEEAATGTSNGALTFYLACYGVIKKNVKNVVIQGEKMGRPSRIETVFSTTSAGEPEVRVGGRAVILAGGEIYI